MPIVTLTYMYTCLELCLECTDRTRSCGVAIGLRIVGRVVGFYIWGKEHPTSLRRDCSKSAELGRQLACPTVSRSAIQIPSVKPALAVRVVKAKVVLEGL
jgi:hypothetical protein